MRTHPSNLVPSSSRPGSGGPGGPAPLSSTAATIASRARARRRGCLLGVGAVTLLLSAVLGPPVWHLAWTAWRDAPPGQFAAPAGHADDVSHLNLTPVAEVWQIPETAAEAEGQLRELLRRARATGRRVSVAGARHSMGGHTLYPDGIVVDIWAVTDCSESCSRPSFGSSPTPACGCSRSKWQRRRRVRSWIASAWTRTPPCSPICCPSSFPETGF